MPFDFDSETRRQLGYKLIDRIDEYFPVCPSGLCSFLKGWRTFADLGEPLPELGQDAAVVLDNLCSEIIARAFTFPVPTILAS